MDRAGRRRFAATVVLVGSSAAGLACTDRESPGGELGTAADTTGTTAPGDGDPGDGDPGDGDGDGDPGGPLPNIDVLMTRDLVEDSVWTTTQQFAPDDCAIVEGCIDQPGARRLLRFSTYTPNVGVADFVGGSPTLEPERFTWDECHEHWHFLNYAAYRLLDERGKIVASGHKMSFSLMDLAPWQADAEPGKYPLHDGTQGISVGWADAYVSQIDCQWVDITGLAAGEYQLEITVNPDAVIQESDHGDNTLLIPISLTDVDSGPPGPPDDWSCPLPTYGANDVCDCGCGAFDPDCPNPTAAACEVCNQVGSCAQDEADCSSIAPNDNAMCE
ncbi:Lysyl oxidase [Enhygromyxa salina]|uniref:Lysyl oxidase n=2 Tax=Enhygromyxa salina TaxID=215803 RepID=A0A2S9YU58_9BACT|nr:Lysyl oxidase [Enhygromyxa salina]